MKVLLIASIALLICVTAFAQSELDNAYALFQKIDWAEWNQIDTGNCISIETKYVTRRKYASYFDVLLCPGVAKDTVEKYMGIGGKFSYGNNRLYRNVIQSSNSGNYCLIYDCQTREWVSIVYITYKSDVLVKYTMRAIYY